LIQRFHFNIQSKLFLRIQVFWDVILCHLVNHSEHSEDIRSH